MVLAVVAAEAGPPLPDTTVNLRELIVDPADSLLGLSNLASVHMGQVV